MGFDRSTRFWRKWAGKVEAEQRSQPESADALATPFPGFSPEFLVPRIKQDPRRIPISFFSTQGLDCKGWLS